MSVKKRGRKGRDAEIDRHVSLTVGGRPMGDEVLYGMAVADGYRGRRCCLIEDEPCKYACNPPDKLASYCKHTKNRRTHVEGDGKCTECPVEGDPCPHFPSCLEYSRDPADWERYTTILLEESRKQDQGFAAKARIVFDDK